MEDVLLMKLDIVLMMLILTPTILAAIYIVLMCIIVMTEKIEVKIKSISRG